jgi:hypothetical protein
MLDFVDEADKTFIKNEFLLLVAAPYVDNADIVPVVDSLALFDVPVEGTALVVTVVVAVNKYS